MNIYMWKIVSLFPTSTTYHIVSIYKKYIEILEFIVGILSYSH